MKFDKLTLLLPSAGRAGCITAAFAPADLTAGAYKLGIGAGDPGARGRIRRVAADLIRPAPAHA